jgi:hypothetical protein
MRVVECLAYARAYGDESSRPLAKHFRCILDTAIAFLHLAQ